LRWFKKITAMGWEAYISWSTPRNPKEETSKAWNIENTNNKSIKERREGEEREGKRSKKIEGGTVGKRMQRLLKIGGR